MPPTSGRAAIMNNDGDNGAGAQHIHYGQQSGPPQQQQDERQPNYNKPPLPSQHPQQQQQPQPQHIPGAMPNNPYGAAGILMNNNAGGAGIGRREDGDHRPMGVQPNTPLFERLVTEEVQELKAYARIIESQNRRLAELERVHGDLETRLELESRAKQQLEATLEERERQWHERYASLEKDRDHWKEVVQIEQNKNSRLIEQVVRKDQDIQKMLQRKYDQPRDGHFNQTVRNLRPPGAGHDRDRSGTPNSSSRSPSLEQHKSPHEILAANGSAEAVRVRNVAHTLLDFFNMR